MKLGYQLGLILFLMSFAGLQPGFGESGKQLPKGMWGGQGVRMDVSESDAVLDFGCGSATIDGPILMDQNGNFQAKGTYKQGDFGPTREGASSGREASFTGKLDGDTLKFEMVLSGEDRVQKFTVTRGRSTRIVGCK